MKWPTAPFVPIDKADQQRGFPNTSMKFVQNLEGFRNKARFEDKVLGRIPGDRQFGCNDEFGAGRGQTFVRLKDLFEVTAQIPHGGIELGETDFHTAGRKLNAGEPAATRPSPQSSASVRERGRGRQARV